MPSLNKAHGPMPHTRPAPVLKTTASIPHSSILWWGLRPLTSVIRFHEHPARIPMRDNRRCWPADEFSADGIQFVLRLLDPSGGAARTSIGNRGLGFDLARWRTREMGARV